MSLKLQFPQVEAIYQRDPCLKKETVEEIKVWLKEQHPHLPHLEEFQILLFLHSCYYQPEATKTTIVNYFAFRNNSELFKDVTLDLVEDTLASVFIGFLPKLTPNGDAVFLMKMLDCRPEKHHCVNQIKVVLLIMMLHLHQYGPVNGVIVVSDVEGVTIRHMFKVSLSAMRSFIYFVQEAAPVRIKSIHQIHANPLAERVIHLFKPFTKKELFDLLYFHSNSMNSFYKFVPIDCLPEDYGGLLPSLIELKERNLKNIVDNWELVEWHKSQKVSESN